MDGLYWWLAFLGSLLAIVVGVIWLIVYAVRRGMAGGMKGEAIPKIPYAGILVLVGGIVLFLLARTLGMNAMTTSLSAAFSSVTSGLNPVNSSPNPDSKSSDSNPTPDPH